MLSTPAVRLILGTPALLALGTPLPVILPTSITGARNYHREGQIDWRVVRDCLIAGFLGTFIGSMLNPWLGGHLLMLLTAVIVFAIGLDFATGARQRRLASQHAASSYQRSRSFSIGAIGGFLSGLLGIGGGVFMVPAFIVSLGMPAKKAFGTSLVVVAGLAVPGTLIHWRLGHIDWMLALWLTLGVIPGAHLGSIVALRARESRLVNGFGVFLMTIALIFAGQEVLHLLQGR